MMAGVDLVVLCLHDDAARRNRSVIESWAGSQAQDHRRIHRPPYGAGWVYGFPELVAGQAEEVARPPRGQPGLLRDRRDCAGAAVDRRGAAARDSRSRCHRSAAIPAAGGA